MLSLEWYIGTSQWKSYSSVAWDGFFKHEITILHHIKKVLANQLLMVCKPSLCPAVANATERTGEMGCVTCPFIPLICLYCYPGKCKTSSSVWKPHKCTAEGWSIFEEKTLIWASSPQPPTQWSRWPPCSTSGSQTSLNLRISNRTSLWKTEEDTGPGSKSLCSLCCKRTPMSCWNQMLIF